MADRQVKTVLEVQMDQYTAGMRKAAQATRETGSEAEKLAQQGRAFELLGRTSLAAGGVIAAGLAVAVGKFVEFDQAMSNVQAATHETTQNMEALREAALEAGASTVFSATESANAIEELSKAGISTADILGGALGGSLDLAAAGGLGVARAAEIAATTLQQFRLDGNQASHVADLLAAGAGKAMGDVEDLSQALAQGGWVASQFGISVEETTGVLSAFASAGLLGSDAGTSFRSMLLRLANPTEEVKNLMKDLGFEAYNSQGDFIGLSALAGELETSLDGMTQAQKDQTLALIFGQDAIRAANVLYREGEDGIKKWTAAVDDAGYAAETAQTRLDNLAGDWEALNGAVDTALITMGSAADGPLRSLVQGLTGLVDKFNEMPDGAQQAVFWIGLVGATGATAYGSYLLLVPKIAEFNEALGVLGPKAQTAARGIGAVARVGGGALAGVAIGATALELLRGALDSIGPSAEITANRVKTAADSALLFNAAMEEVSLFGVGNAKLAELQIRSLGSTLDDFAAGRDNPLMGNTIVNLEALGGELAKLAEAELPAAQRQFRRLSEEANLTEAQQSILLDRMPALKAALTEQATAAGVAADEQTLLDYAMGGGVSAAQDQKSALEELQGVTVDTTTEVNVLADAIRDFGSSQFDTEQATIKFYDSVSALDAILAQGAGSLDVTTEAGRETLSAMLDAASSTNDYAASVAAMGGSTEDVQGILESGRQKIIDTRIALGDSEQAAKEYADQLIATPETIQTQINLNGVAEAERQLQRLLNYDGRSVSITATVAPARINPFPDLPQFASGGAVTGPGSSTSDSILARLSPGEHVLTAADVAAMGGHHAVYQMRDGLHGGGSAPAPVSINGATITGVLEIGGDGLGRIIDGRISTHDASAARSARGRVAR